MIGYPYTYGDTLTEEEALSNFTSFIADNKYVVIGFCFMLVYAKSVAAVEVAVTKNGTIPEGGPNTPPTPNGAGPAPPQAPKGVIPFALIAAVGLGAGPKTRTFLLIGATGAICYLAFTGDDKSLYAACGLLVSKVGEILKPSQKE